MLKVRELLGFRCWDRTCSTWEAYLRWKTRGFPSEARALLSVSNVHERNKAALLLSPSKQHKRVPTSTCSIDIPKKRDDLQTLQKHLGNLSEPIGNHTNMARGYTFQGVYVHTLVYLLGVYPAIYPDIYRGIYPGINSGIYPGKNNRTRLFSTQIL